jgi:nuclear pore complex protein Nup205
VEVALPRKAYRRSSSLRGSEQSVAVCYTYLYTKAIQYSLKSRVIDAEPINTIPENLGQPYCQAGIDPFVVFVIDKVLLHIMHREDNREHWQMNDLCLAFLKQCLASFNDQVLLTLLKLLMTHPGFSILQRILY